MCKAFSCIVTRGDKVYWKAGVNSHEDIIDFFKKDDKDLVDDKMPPLNTFARIEIVPPDGNYLDTRFSRWNYMLGTQIKPTFLVKKHERLCRAAFRVWVENTYTFNIKEAKKPICPFKIVPPETITEEHITLVKKWAAVRDSMWDSVGVSVWDSVWDSVGAYIGSLFPITTWKYIDYKNPLFKRGEYPFQSLVDLWKAGLVPSFNGKIWRLHGGENGKVLWEGELK